MQPNISEYRHLEQGGCYTSQIAQGQTAGMSGADFGAKNPDLITFRAMLITASRAQRECKIVAPDLAELEKLIARDVSQETALPESKYRQTEGLNRDQAQSAHGERHEYGVASMLRREQAERGLREELRPEFGRAEQTASDRQMRSLEEDLQPEFGNSSGRHIGPVHMPAAPTLEAAGRQRKKRSAHFQARSHGKGFKHGKRKISPLINGRSVQARTPAKWTNRGKNRRSGKR